MAKNLFELLNRQSSTSKKKGFFSRRSTDDFVATSDEFKSSELGQYFDTYSNFDVESVTYTEDNKVTVALGNGIEIPNLKVVNLSELHEKGEYHPKMDVTVFNEGFTDAYDKSFEAVWSDPKNASIMDVNIDINEHRVRVFSHLMKHGGMDCEFYDNEGNKLDYPKPECDEYGRPAEVDRLRGRKLEALIYGMDHGLVQCKMQDGTMYNPNDIDDGFIDKLDYYDSKLEFIDKAGYEVAKNTTNIIESDLSSGRASSYIPDYLKSDEIRQQFVSDLRETCATNVNYYANAMECYKSGKNPYEQMLESMKMSSSAEKVETKALEPIHDMQTLHQNGGYHPNDVTFSNGYMDAIDYGVDMTSRMPGMSNGMNMRSDLNYHNFNVINEVYKQSRSDLLDCEFYDNHGNKLDLGNRATDSYGRPEDKDNARMREHHIDALVYGMDKGLIQCRMPNGETFDSRSVSDAYTRSPIHFENDRQAADKANMLVYENAAYKLSCDIQDGKAAKYVPDFIQSEETKSAYLADLHAQADANFRKYQDNLHCYEQGIDPRMQMLKSMGADVQPEMSQAKPVYSKATNDKIQSVMANASRFESSNSEHTFDTTYGG